MPFGFTEEELDHFSMVLSASRLSTYLKETDNNQKLAMDLYLWQMKLCAAFSIPLHIFEISFRNTVAEAVANVHGNKWPWKEGFIQSIPRQKKYYCAQNDLRRKAKEHETTGSVVAGLRFAFWEKMLTNRHVKIWEEQFPIVFTGWNDRRPILDSVKYCREEAERIRKFRNRIAHHEPIFSRNLNTDYKRLIEMLNLINPAVGDWIRRVSTVEDILGERPDK
ncbi:MAG: hypothetical protein DSZ28_01680 [Thiothrix sp.]|jgi:hypothetical protein|nr:MAG: hypothetical protein DSZ28_01680 [Thiothrix sp.]